MSDKIESDKNNNDLKQVETKLIQGLTKVRQCLIQQSEDLKFSIRKDIVCADLKNILIENLDYPSLKSAIEKYAEDIINIQKEE